LKANENRIFFSVVICFIASGKVLDFHCLKKFLIDSPLRSGRFDRNSTFCHRDLEERLPLNL